LTIKNGTYDGAIGDEYPNPEGGILFTNMSSQGSFPWGYYMGLVKDVASTSSTSIRFDIGKSSDLNTNERTGGTDTLTPYFTIDNGSVGIGTTNPTAQLHISSGNSGDCVLKIEADKDNNNELDNPRIEFLTDGGYNTALVGAGQMPFESSNDNALVLAALQMKFYTGTQDFTDSTNMTECIRINSDGEVGINDTTPSYKLDVNGTLRCFGFTNSSSDDRIKYNEQNVSNALTLISQLNPQKYEKIMERPNPAEGTWIPTDEEWENVKEDYTYGDEYGFIAQDVRNIPELSFLVSGEETRTDTKTSTPEEYSNLTTEEQSTYTISYLHESNVVTQEQYSNLSPEEQEVSVTQYTKQIETQTPLALNYQGLFVVAIGAIKELKAKNDALEARITALENA